MVNKGGVVKCFLLDSGSGAITKINAPILLQGMRDTADYFATEKAASDITLKPGASRKLREKYGITLDGALCATKPFDFYLFAYAVSLNTYHMRCCEVKTKDIAKRPWKLTGDGADKLKAQIQALLDQGWGQLSFAEGLGNVWMDREALGNGYFEIVPDSKGQPAAFNHIPSTEMWIRLDGLGFVQQKNGIFSHFRAYGLTEKQKEQVGPNDPILAEGCTEVVHIGRYTPWSQYYGIPCIMPAWNRMVLSVLETEYNLGFFSNNAIPDYAVILEGEWADDSEEVIREYFKTHLKGKAHKTLAMQVPTGGKITFQRLTSDNAKEGSFRLMRQDNRDEIIHAHGVPPQKVGIVEHGRMGGNSGDEQIEEYKNSVVTPGQEAVEKLFGKIFSLGFATEDVKLEFDAYDTEDKKANAEIDGVYLDRQVLLPNEVRAREFPDLDPLPGGDVPLARAGAQQQGGGDLESVQRSLRKLISLGDAA